MDQRQNLLPGPGPTFLPGDVEPEGLRSAGTDPAEVAARFPTYSTAWADLADRAFAAGDPIASYAYARVGYHRGLDALRGNGWKGFGPVPWSHEPNRGFLRSVWALSRAAGAIGEEPERVRCADLLAECDPEAVAALAG